MTDDMSDNGLDLASERLDYLALIFVEKFKG